MSDKTDAAFAVVVNGARYEIDPNTITLGERRTARMEFDKLGGQSDNWDYLAGLIWLAVRRVHPDFTLQQVLDSVTVGSLEPPEVDELDPKA